ncbi:rhamnosyltransferase WsaF family glycosyltransferase [Granulicella arctica]|uniref:rhamnosyltransferase WsaF family glycosyltransferase n=1 Tax=Granulicella arctica TaxID=940613 RepID=UPI0021E008BA|nr:glycosyltransferase family 1 protein [Granulicella arctica]
MGNEILAQMGRRYRQLWSIWGATGYRGLAARLRSAAAARLIQPNSDLPVRRADVLAADLAHPVVAHSLYHSPGEPLTINWVIIPAAPRSGGHTTLFRIIRYLEDRGHTNRLHFYNVYGGDHLYYEKIARESYGFTGQIKDLNNNMEDAHAVIATSWATAYPVFNSAAAAKKFYFVQDFEPSFYPVGAISLLAENTYRMGFQAITAGRWLSERLASEFGMIAEAFEFGCDTSVYHLLPRFQRSGIVFYARPEAARRGYELGMMALELFAQRNPDVQIHLYGEQLGAIPFPCTHHGRISPLELNELYNRCSAGLSLSLTNVSLVPHEMLAAGCIPVVNDAPQNRMVLDNPYVEYADPYPQSLVAALENVFRVPAREALASAASASVRNSTWESAGATVENILRRAVSDTELSSSVLEVSTDTPTALAHH